MTDHSRQNNTLSMSIFYARKSDPYSVLTEFYTVGWLYLGPKPLGLLGKQLGQMCVLCVQKSVESSLVVACLSGHSGTL